MPKRRKASQSTVTDDNDSVASGPTPNKRRRKPMVQYDPAELCQELYETIRTYKSDDGRLVCEAFVRVPKRRTEPEYYDKVSSPIDLLKIQHKLKSEEYDDIDQFTSDIQLLLNNAKTFYKKSSQEYQDAVELWDLFVDTKQELFAEVFGDSEDVKKASLPLDNNSEVESNTGDAILCLDEELPGMEPMEAQLSASALVEEEEDKDETASNNNNEEQNQLEDLFSAVAGAKDNNNRNIADLFKLLPLRSIYPAYYEIIKDPIDLKTIAMRVQGGEYRNLDDLSKDLNLMIHNAKTFNEPGSSIYNDAKALANIMKLKKAEIEREGRGRPRRSTMGKEERRPRRHATTINLSAEVAALEYPQIPVLPTVLSIKDPVTDYEEESGAEGSIVGGEEDNIQLALFTAVQNYKNPLGQLISEPFMKLPSKRMYPDYYDEIKNPISLLNIRKKIRDGQYDTLEDLANDMDLLFDNAKHYNVDESRLYQDALILQKVMWKKRQEIETGKREEMECLSDITLTVTPQPRNRRSGPEDEDRKRGRKSIEEILRKRLWLLYRTVFDYKCDGRSLIDIFITLPSRKEYPDYYQVISEPIDMTMIEAKIKAEKYPTETSLIDDFQLMFNNARHYNEEASQLYQDADSLEKVLKAKLRNLTPLDDGPRAVSKGKSNTRAKSMSPLSSKLVELYDTIKDHSDAWGRTLSTPFMRLPLKNEYPDYYEVIKRPIDLLKINQRMTGHQYSCVDDMVSDIALMFDNACRYNEPDSLIYKDALTLQRICLEKKAELSVDDNDVPDIKAAIQELMTSLFIATYNHTDEDGRSYCDSFLDMPSIPEEEALETEDKDKVIRRTPSFDQVKKNLDKSRYRRVDRFQQDMLEVFKYARKVSRTDSQLYEDSVELEQFFLKMRDELCRNGEHVMTPALGYTEQDLMLEIEEEKKEKLPREQKEDEEKRKQQEAEQEKVKETGDSEASLDFEEQTYHIGDFVYIEPREKGMEPHIVCIEKLWKDEQGEQWLHGCWFLRPNETYHLATRKFLEREVFKSDFYDSCAFSQVLSKCYVMCVKEYFKLRPEGFQEKDVYVCESRYSAKHKAFKKIKIWQVPKNEHVTILPREEPLPPIRVASVFAEKEDSMDVDDGFTDVLDTSREIVLAEPPAEEDGNIYYEQFQGAQGWFKLGDFVYVRNLEGTRITIYRMDKLLTDSCGVALFQGPYFSQPTEVAHTPTRLFYRQEVFHSSSEHTVPLDQVNGHCGVMFHKEYCLSRPTEIPEQHMYVCESRYHESEKSIRKLAKGMKKHSLSSRVCEDEIYFFKKPIMPRKEPSPLLAKASEEVYQEQETISSQETSMNESFQNPEQPVVSTPTPTETPVKEKKKVVSKKRKGHISAYLVFAGLRRKQLAEETPKTTFGEISKIVGHEWRELPKSEKVKYEERAKKIAEEQAAKQAEADRAMQESLNKFPPQPAPSTSQAVQQPTAGFAPSMAQQGVFPGYAQSPYPNQTMGNTPITQGYQPGTPMPGTPQLMQNGYPRSLMGPPAPPGTPLPCVPGMNGTPQLGATPHQGNQHTPGQPQHAASPMPPPPPPRPPSPMFVAVPPKTQRLLHSEAYLRYIEGLSPEKKSLGDWEKTLKATRENTEPNPNTRLPTHWLGQGEGAHGSTLNALWALRDLMLKDTLTISKTLEFSQL